ncbi:MAG: alkaline phosphatase [Nevskia sp.]
MPTIPLLRRLAGLLILSAATAAQAAAIYPIDRAEMLAGARFDLRIDFAGVVAPDSYTLTINGRPYEAVLGARGRFVGEEADSRDPEKNRPFSNLRLPGVALKPGRYEVQLATAAGEKAAATWTVYAAAKPKAKNVILFIGDGMTVANRTAARILSRGLSQGKYLGHLSFDDFPYTALIGTSSVDSIATDSANSMSAYTTGHKGSVNALGVYASKSIDPLDHPNVETIGELVKRLTRKSVGVVTDAEVEDATPAGMFVHTRQRREYLSIVEQFAASGVDVLMGGGSVCFLPKSAPLVLPLPDAEAYKRRPDERNLLDEFAQRGYATARTAGELATAAAQPGTRRLLGLFHEGNLDGALDRHVLKQGTVAQFPEQPDLTQMTRDAIAVLSRNPDGFVLMVEAGLIDKFSHRLDGERSVYDTILLSNAVKVATDWAAPRGDTLIIVTPDHTHPMSLIGDIDENIGADEARDQVGTYAKAKFPTYPKPDAEGYPDTVLATRHLDLVYGAHPDYYETYSPKLDGPNEPTECTKKDPKDETRCLVYGANSKYAGSPRAQLRVGNLPHGDASGVHAVDDGVLSATGPGAEQFHGFMENTEVFKAMVTALGLGAPATRR